MNAALAIKSTRPYVHPKKVIESITKQDIAGAKVYLINMPLRESAVPNCAPNGIALLAARLETYGVKVQIIDLNAYRIKDQIATIKGMENGRHLTHQETYELITKYFIVHGEPDVVALSGMITTLRWQEDVAKIIRKLAPDVFMVAGNGLATEFKAGLFNWIPELDAVAHSEGDFSIVKIVFDALKIKHDGFQHSFLSGKLDPYYFGEASGRHRFIYDGGRPGDLDEVPFPAYHLIEKDVNGFGIMDMYLNNEIWGLAANNSSATPFTMKRSINTVSSRGCPYACISGDNLVATRGKMFYPKDIELGQTLICDDGHEHRVAADGMKFVSNGVKECVKIYWEKGKEMRLTPDHLVRCVVNDQPAWKPAGAVSVGDWVISENGQNDIKKIFEFKTMKPIAFNPSNPLKSVRLPKYLDEDLAWLLGYFVGDGCLPKDGRSAINFAVKPRFEKKLKHLTKRLFDKDLSLLEFKTTKLCKNGWLYSKMIRRYFEEVLGITSDTKLRVPRSVFESPKSVVLAFLNGLFDADGDKYLEHNHRGLLATSSPLLAKEVTALISWIGDFAVVHGPYSTKTLPRFHVTWHSDGCFSRARGIPCIVSRVPMSYRTYKRDGVIRKRKLSESKRSGICRDSLQSIDPSHPFLNRQWSFVQVLSTENVGKREVFDLEEETTHTFTVNGSLVKNCNFCFRGATGERNYAVRSAENFANELKFYYEKYGVDFVGVTDDNFAVKRDRIANLVPILKPFIQETGLRWGTHARLDEAADLRPDGKGGDIFNLPKRVDQMAEAGCVYIGFGAESADKMTLENMGKGGFILSNGTIRINGWDFPRTMVEGIKNTKYSGIHANCILEGQSVLAPDAIGATKAFYDGWCIEITLENGHRISVTENHPILTTRGWVFAKDLNQFDQAFIAVNGERIAAAINPNNNQRPTNIENIFRSFHKSNSMISGRMKVAPQDFHGDARFIQGDVDVVRPDGFLLSNLKSLASKARGQFGFYGRDILMNYLKSLGPINSFFDGGLAPASGAIGGGYHRTAFSSGQSSIFNFESATHRGDRTRPMLPRFKGGNSMKFPWRSQRDSSSDQFPSKPARIDMKLASQFKKRFAGSVATDRITNIKRFRYSGHVYDLQCSEYGLYNCNSLIVSNCTWIEAYPGETLQQLKTTVAFIQWQKEFYATFGDKPDSVNSNLFVATAYPGTAMFKDPRVKKLLGDNFGIKYDDADNPICDDALHYYVLELDDATKILHDQNGQPLNFSDMPMDTFLKTREYVENGKTEKILDM